MLLRPIREFLRVEAIGGALLMLTLVAVLIIANTPLYSLYYKITHLPLQIRLGSFLDLNKSLELWVDEGLMALFFMLLALEIKREVLVGELSSFSRIILPIFAAIGGIVVPIAIFFAIVHGHGRAMIGWAIPTTTDIALALGILALLGKRIPVNLKLFLVALSIVDDIAAVVLIALFYSDHIALLPLFISFGGLAVLFIFNKMGIKKISPYMIVGVIIWVAVLKSGVHATLAGLAVGFFIPLNGKTEDSVSPLRHLEHLLHPWVSYLIMPIFVFMNAGVPLTSSTEANLLHPLPLGIAFGLFFGKQIGIYGFSLLAVKCRLAKLPHGVNWWQVYGIGVLAGIGFTMSLFIAGLAFSNGPLELVSRQGILLGSFLSGVLGTIVLYRAGAPKKDYLPIALKK